MLQSNQFINIFTLSLNKDFSLSLTFSLSVLVIISVIIVILIVIKWFINKKSVQFEIEAAEIGIGSHKITFKPNIKDKEIAYKIWVELSTRKIGLPINLTDDVISEIYDSWYNFFSITRELIKDIPVNKLKNDSTRQIVDLSINVLNEGLRPHLTLWQARFKHWYDIQINNNTGDFDPQSIQAKYPKFDVLKNDLIKVNNGLMKYRERMKELVLGLPQSKKIKIDPKPSLSDN